MSTVAIMCQIPAELPKIVVFVDALLAAARRTGENVVPVIVQVGNAVSKQAFDDMGIKCEVLRVCPEEELPLYVDSIKKTAALTNSVAAVLKDQKASVVVALADNTANLAGAHAGRAHGLKLVHGESGQRTPNLEADGENYGYALIGWMADLCYASTQTGADNLRREGVLGRVVFTGEPYLDYYRALVQKDGEKAEALRHSLSGGHSYYLAVFNTRGVTGDAKTLIPLLEACDRADRPVLLPVTPGLQKLIGPWTPSGNLKFREEQSLDNLLHLMAGAERFATSSHSMVRFAYFAGIPAVAVFPDGHPNGWHDLYEAKQCLPVGPDPVKFLEALQTFKTVPCSPHLLGDGTSGPKMVKALFEVMGWKPEPSAPAAPATGALLF
ncbi:MAG: UDP-N-acetylglucosamine 2-epimerase [Pseudomonadota bacterium]|nr:UDP-N-acetylglucosamine 2-epimerase [Pseudomonadota bacterium]